MEDADREEEGKHQFVALEEGSADVGVDVVGEEVIEVLDALVDVWRRRGEADGGDEEVAEPLQAVLVHRVDGAEVGNAKIQDGGTIGHGFVQVPAFVDLLFCHLCFLHFDHDLGGLDLGRACGWEGEGEVQGEVCVCV